jgi:hypothetical protein
MPKARVEIVAKPPRPGGIGTLRETGLHADLKRWYAQPGDEFEIALDGFVIDIRRGQHLIEIQTRSFSSMRRKLLALAERHPVRVVHPARSSIACAWSGRPGRTPPPAVILDEARVRCAAGGREHGLAAGFGFDSACETFDKGPVAITKRRRCSHSNVERSPPAARLRALRAAGDFSDSCV